MFHLNGTLEMEISLPCAFAAPQSFCKLGLVCVVDSLCSHAPMLMLSPLRAAKKPHACTLMAHPISCVVLAAEPGKVGPHAGCV